MKWALPKKVRLLLEISTLYSYFFHRFIVQIRAALKLPPLYPSEESYRFDAETQIMVDQMKEVIADHERGDNSAFNKNWKSVFEREEVARRVSGQISRITGGLDTASLQDAVNSLSEIGYVKLETKNLNPDHVHKILQYLDQQKVYPSHIAHFAVEKPRARETIKRKSPFGSYDVQTILRAPFVARLLSDRDVLGMIGNYMGCLPTVSSVDLFWSFDSKDNKPQGP